MKKTSIILGLLLMLTIVLGYWYFFLGGEEILKQVPREYLRNFFVLVAVSASLSVLYKVGSFFLKSIWLRSGAKEGEVVMIQGVFRFFLIVVGFFAIVSDWFSLGQLGAIFAAFGGMFLGWSLQGPISGLAAWLLVSLIRPFSVGDRVQLPSYGLVGDIVSITPLYTILNQVGGSIGSEEPANRTLLIPNAMLFGALIINYTPKDQQELMAQSRKRFKTTTSPQSAYMLDEFILRLSFDSDWDEAEKILLNAAREVTGDIIKATGQEPYIRADMTDWYGAYMRLRFMTMATDRPKIIHEISKKVFKAIQASDKVDLAIPYIYSFRKGFKWAPPYSLEDVDTLKRVSPLKESADEKVICPTCTAENSSDSLFCNKCGQQLEKTSAS